MKNYSHAFIEILQELQRLINALSLSYQTHTDLIIDSSVRVIFKTGVRSGLATHRQSQSSRVSCDEQKS